MWNSQFKTTTIILCLLFLQPMVSPGSIAFAKKKRPPRAYTFIAEGGKVSQGECDGERKISSKLKRFPEFSKTGSYMGSELINPELKGNPNVEMWKHLFKSKEACNSILAKTPSRLEDSTLKAIKTELTPDEAVEVDSESDSESTESPETE